MRQGGREWTAEGARKSTCRSRGNSPSSRSRSGSPRPTQPACRRSSGTPAIARRGASSSSSPRTSGTRTRAPRTPAPSGSSATGSTTAAIQDLARVNPVLVAAYIEQLTEERFSKPTVKQHLAAIRMLFDYLVTGGILPFNPASSVRGPKHVVKRGKTPVLTGGRGPAAPRLHPHRRSRTGHPTSSASATGHSSASWSSASLASAPRSR